MPVSPRDPWLITMKEKPILTYALDATDHRRVTAEQCLDAAGRDDPLEHPPLRCPVCGENVHAAHMQDRAHTAHFVHIAGERAQCPLVNSMLPVTSTFTTIYPYDAALGHQRRNEFAQHWQQHLAEIRRHVPSFSVVRLTHGIAQADVLHMWSCPTLAQQDIPYVLLVLSAFIAQNPGAAHPSWLRFVFDASVQNIADLRQPRSAAPRLFRLRYRASHHSMFPNASHLLDWAEVPMSGAFLHETFASVMVAEAATFAQFMDLDAQASSQPGESRLFDD
jgi:hypothetical protein